VKHRLEVKGWIRVCLWCVLALVPMGILMLVMARLPLRGSWEVVVSLILAIAGVLVISGAAMWVILENIARIHYHSRHGKACVRCAYDMQRNLDGTCPECGLEHAAYGPYTLPPQTSRTIAIALGAVMIAGLAVRFVPSRLLPF
jgi:uncharacterized paraquat-inducible protein A